MKLRMVVVLGILSLLTACATPVERYVTSSGLPEVFIDAPLATVKPQMIAGYQEAGWVLVSDSEFSTSFSQPCGPSLGCAVGQALIGNQYSTAPNLEITLSWIRRGDESKVIMSDFSLSTQMAFGQTNRQSLLANNQTFNREVDTLRSWKTSLETEYGGIGLQGEYESELFVVKSLVAGGPAQQQSDLSAGEVILEVAQGSSEEFVDVRKKTIGYLVSLLRGEVGSVVSLKVAPLIHSADEVRIITLKRGLVTLPTE